MAIVSEDGIDRISNSEIQTFKRCRRKWWLAYYRCLAPTERAATGPLQLGTMVHEALAAMYSPAHENPLVIFEKQVLEDLETFPEQQVEIEKQADLGRAMLEGYIEWVAETGVDQGLRIVAVETRMEVDAGVPNTKLIGKLDVRVEREQDGVVLFLDHKTVANLTEPIRTLHMDEQMLHYHLLEYMDYLAVKAEAEAYGQQPPTARHTDGGLYNMLRKVKRTERAKPPFFDRVEVRHNLHELRSHWLRVHGVIREIQETRRQLDTGADSRYVAYPTPTRDCTWQCEFFPVCPLFDDGSNAEGLLSEYFSRYNPLDRYKTEGTDEG